MRIKLMFLFLVLSALFLTVSAQDNPCGVEGVVIEASSFAYAPSAVEVEVGQTVVWVNVQGTHDVNASMSSIGEMWDNPETFNLPAVTGSSEGVCIGSHTFTVEGTYDYDCSIGNHAANGMVASVTVNPATQSNSVVDIIVNSPDHTVLEAAVTAAGLVDALSADGPLTVFAPTDDAITTLVTALGISAEELLALPNLGEILQYHVVTATAMAADLSDGQMITTLLGQDVEVSVSEAGVFINNAQVTAADITASNGVVHVIDAVLVPAPPQTTVLDIIANSPDHTVLEAAVTAVGLVGALSDGGTLTVFAPTDDAFTPLLAALGITVEELLAFPGLIDILLYHVVGAQALSSDLTDGQQITTLLEDNVLVTINPGGIFINQSQVTVADLIADNGVVHVIDAVLLPEPVATTTVADIIVESDVHTMLEDALIATDLIGVLSGEGPFTVFAPTDDAFDALPAGTLEALLNDIDFLTYILVHHLAGDFVLSSDFSDGQEITTLLGVDVQVTITGDGVFINQAQVIVADLIADNGVVHVIDAVLMPYSTGCTEISACNFDINAEEDDGSCEYQSCAGCMDAEACNFDAEFSIAINDECTYPGCSDPLAINYNADAGCPLDCIYLTFDCSSVGNAAWTDEPIGVFPDWQESMIGVVWNGEWVFNIPEMVEEPQSLVDYGVHHVDWISFEGLPNWIEESDFALGELSQSSQHCITATGIPTEQGVIEVIATGEVFISLFGAEFSIGEQSFSAILEVIDNPNLIPGCMYETALNYLSYAEIDDGSCLFAGCTDESAGNYSPLATIDDGSCGEPCSPGGDNSCPTDITGDGFVNVSDLLELLSDFGAECIIEVIEFTCGDPMNYYGYDYTTVLIGDQCWFAENLRNEHYANGDSIPGQLCVDCWWLIGSGAQAIYNNDVSNLADYGRLYNGYAVHDARGLCPSGWHVPTDGEFMTLEMELGMSESEANGTDFRGTDQGTQMKSSPVDSPSWDGTNTSGFSALAGGIRGGFGSFQGMGGSVYFWSASSQDTSSGWYREMYSGYTGVKRYGEWYGSGFSVRCVQD